MWDADSDDESDTSSESDESDGEGAEKSRIGKLSKKLKKGLGKLKSHNEDEPRSSTLEADAFQQRKARHSLKHEPRVYHGYTATKDIAFRTVCETIREHAFKTRYESRDSSPGGYLLTAA